MTNLEEQLAAHRDRPAPPAKRRGFGRARTKDTTAEVPGPEVGADDLADELARTRQENTDLTVQVADLTARLEALTSTGAAAAPSTGVDAGVLEDVRTELDQVRTELDQARLDAGQAHERAEELSSDLEVARTELDQARADLAARVDAEADADTATHQALMSARTELAKTAAKVANLTSALELAKTAHTKATSDAAAELAATEERHRSVLAQLEHLRGVHDDIVAELDQANQAAAAHMGQVRDLEDQLETTRAQAAQDVDRAQGALLAVRAELDQVRTGLEAENQELRDQAVSLAAKTSALRDQSERDRAALDAERRRVGELTAATTTPRPAPAHLALSSEDEADQDTSRRRGGWIAAVSVGAALLAAAAFALGNQLASVGPAADLAVGATDGEEPPAGPENTGEGFDQGVALAATPTDPATTTEPAASHSPSTTTPSPTTTPAPSPTPTKTNKPTASPTPTPSKTKTPTPTPSKTKKPAPSPTPTPTKTKKPKPTPTPTKKAGTLKSLRASIRTSVGTATVTATVTSQGPVPVKVTATVGGVTLTLDGPAELDGTATYTATFTDLPEGAHTWTVNAGSLSYTGTVEVF